MTINTNNNNRYTNILNSKCNSSSIKPQTTNISNISHGTVTAAEQNPDNSNLDFTVDRDITPSITTTLATRQTGRKKVHEMNYCSTIQTPVQSNYSNTVSGNASYPLQPPVKRKSNPMGNRNLFIVVRSHIKRIEKDLIVHHLSDKNISLKCKNFDGADVRRIYHHVLPSLCEDQIDSIIIHACTNDISHNKLHTTRPHDLTKKIIDISNVRKSCGFAKIEVSSVFPRKDLDLQKRVAATNKYLKVFIVFHLLAIVTSLKIICIMMKYILTKLVHFY